MSNTHHTAVLVVVETWSPVEEEANRSFKGEAENLNVGRSISTWQREAEASLVVIEGKDGES